MKTCIKCGVEQPLTEFYKHPKMADGHQGRCKTCSRSDALKNRNDNIDRARAYDRERGSLSHRVEARREYAATAVGREISQTAKRKYASSHPDRSIATTAVNNAVRDGRLLRQLCFVCGAEAEAHHPDYSRPLDVVWLCDRHHKDAHKLGREIERKKVNTK